MALIKCPECEREISDKATSCLHCGYPISKMEIMLTVEDVQKHLQVGKNKAYVLFKSKTFPSIKIGGTYLISKSKYEQWIEKSSGKNIIL